MEGGAPLGCGEMANTLIAGQDTSRRTFSRVLTGRHWWGHCLVPSPWLGVSSTPKGGRWPISYSRRKSSWMPCSGRSDTKSCSNGNLRRCRTHILFYWLHASLSTLGQSSNRRPSGKVTHSSLSDRWCTLSGVGKVGSVKHPTAIPILSGRASNFQNTLVPHVGQNENVIALANWLSLVNSVGDPSVARRLSVSK